MLFNYKQKNLPFNYENSWWKQENLLVSGFSEDNHNQKSLLQAMENVSNNIGMLKVNHYY
jgi:hypothetical protein